MFHELQIFENPEAILLVASIIFFFSIIAGKAGFRFGLPALLLFLGVGMLFGSDGLGIQFSNPSAAQFIGMLALSIILFSGGMDTKMSEIKPIATEGAIIQCNRRCGRSCDNNPFTRFFCPLLLSSVIWIQLPDSYSKMLIL